MCETTDSAKRQGPYVMNAKDERLVQLAMTAGRLEHLNDEVHELKRRNDELYRQVNTLTDTKERATKNSIYYQNQYERVLTANNTLKKRLAKLQPKPKKEKK